MDSTTFMYIAQSAAKAFDECVKRHLGVGNTAVIHFRGNFAALAPYLNLAPDSVVERMVQHWYQAVHDFRITYSNYDSIRLTSHIQRVCLEVIASMGSTTPEQGVIVVVKPDGTTHVAKTNPSPQKTLSR